VEAAEGGSGMSAGSKEAGAPRGADIDVSGCGIDETELSPSATVLGRP